MVLSIVELDHLKTIRILLVEDEAFMCEFLLQCFQQEADIDCIAAAVSLSEARAVLRRAQPDVLVTVSSCRTGRAWTSFVRSGRSHRIRKFW